MNQQELTTAEMLQKRLLESKLSPEEKIYAVACLASWLFDNLKMTIPPESFKSVRGVARDLADLEQDRMEFDETWTDEHPRALLME